MRAWIGKTIVIIGVIHSVFGFAVLHSTLAELVSEGLVNTVNGQPMREFTFWFLFFGFLAIIFGAFVDWCERQQINLPHFFGWSFFALTLAIVVIMPASGGWIMFVPAVGAILRSRQTAKFQSLTNKPLTKIR